MKKFDVSLTIHEGMPVWPGDDEVILQRRSKIEEGEHANVSFLSLSAHTGTHVDAPYHFIANGSKVHEIPIDVLVGPAQVVEVPDSVSTINAKVLSSLNIEEKNRTPAFENQEFPLLGRTGGCFSNKIPGSRYERFAKNW